MRKAFLVILVVSTVLPAGCASTRVSSPRISGIYSNLTYTEEAGDLVGMELAIVPSGTGYTAFVQISEGGEPYTVLVPFAVRGSNVEFTLPASPPYSSAHFTGTWGESGLVIRGDNGEPETLKRGHSYWE